MLDSHTMLLFLGYQTTILTYRSIFTPKLTGAYALVKVVTRWVKHNGKKFPHKYYRGPKELSTSQSYIDMHQYLRDHELDFIIGIWYHKMIKKNALD